MKLTIKPMIQAILVVVFTVVLACGLQVGTVNAEGMQTTHPTTPTEQTISPTILPTIMPTMPTILPTVSPEFYEQLQKEAKNKKANEAN